MRTAACQCRNNLFAPSDNAPEHRTMHRIALALMCALFGAFLFSAPASAQSVTRICVQTVGVNGSNNCVDGWAPKLLSGLAGTVTSVKSNNGGLVGTIYCYNPSGAVAYIQLFDAATPGAITLGSTAPKLSLGIPSALASGLGPTAVGIQFLSGIQAAATTTATGSSGSSMDCNVTFN